MLETLNSVLDNVVGWLWGPWTAIFLISGGVFFTLLLGGIQFRAFKHAIDVVRGKYDDPDDPGEISHFKALCAALSGTVGLGNIAGVAVAIKTGGPGATLWMVLFGVIGMATKFVECSLSLKYRKVDDRGVVHGGPMYYISEAFGSRLRFLGKGLAVFFAICTMFAATGAGGMFQSNQVAAAMANSFEIPKLFTGGALAVLTGLVVLGGIKRIGAVAGTLVPVMGVSYVAACLVILVANFGQLPAVLGQMIDGAFYGTAAAGGFAGAAFRTVLVQGIRRAAFSNEAGMGSAAIAHSAARTKEPVREGVVALLEPFIDTVVVCTMTAMVINITGAWTGDLTGVELTQAAMDVSIPGLGTYFIPVAVALFAFSTMISWSYYGGRAVDYLFGERWVSLYKVVYCGLIFVGAGWTLGPVLAFTDSAVALMIFPNMIAILLLWRVVRREATDYFARLKAADMETHTLNQRTPIAA